MAMKRLKSMIPRLSRDEERRKAIFANVAKFEKKGIAVTVDEEIENHEAHEENRPLWHLPLMCVDEPTKIRICHDAKALTRGIGLDNLLIGGSNLTNNLAAILILLRQHKYVFSTDIAGFFHQVLLDERDRDSEIVVKRFLSHVFGSGASSCITSYTTRHLAKLIRNLYPENDQEETLRR